MNLSDIIAAGGAGGDGAAGGATPGGREPEAPQQRAGIRYDHWGRREVPMYAHDTTRDEPWPVGLVSYKYAVTVQKWPASWVIGQIGEISMRRAGSVYMTLRDLDEDVSVNVVGFGEFAHACADLQLRQGDKIVMYGKPDIWQKETRLSIKGMEVYRLGEGDLAARIEQLRRKLKGEGLFDAENKVPLPEFPRCIGLICAPQSRAETDVEKNALLRWPVIRFKKRYAKVQGPECPQQVTAAIRELDADPDVDVIIVARGGGSFEDLLGFSDEGVVRATAACRTPIVSAIGHEDDWTLIELAADYRATTPTGAAMAVVPDVNEQWDTIAAARHSIDVIMERIVRVQETTLDGYLHNPLLTNPATMLDPMEAQLHMDRERLGNAMLRLVDWGQGAIEQNKATLRALSPQSTLERGYAIVQSHDGHVVQDPDDVPDGSELTLVVSRGTIRATKTGGRHTAPAAQASATGDPAEDGPAGGPAEDSSAEDGE
ncbi:exodeoxyribonuclease VII large subunit [Pseudoscardovia radai]|uniref:exodeoxyribonuclease VII large subunit n=1 Tax=Pseudoscardovia radai TaxID=987066 RepID=UPI003991530B